MDDQPKEGEGDKKIVHVYPLVKVRTWEATKVTYKLYWHYKACLISR